MKNILVIDVQYGYLDKTNNQIITLINDYLKKNKFDNSIFTMFVTNYKDNFHKNLFWDGIYDKEEQKIAVKKPMHSKVFKKKSYALNQSIYQYLKENNITEIELCGINIFDSLYVIANQLKRSGIKVVLLPELIFKSKIDNIQYNIDYMPNILKSINGFYFGDMLYNAYKTKKQNDEFPYIKDKVEISDTTILSFAVIDWLINTKQNTQDLFNIIKHYYKLFPNKNNQIYTKNFATWAENGCRSYRTSDDTVALRLCNIIGWYGKNPQHIDLLIKKAVMPVNNNPDAEFGARLLCYTLLLLRAGCNRLNLLKHIKKYFDLDFDVNINEAIKTKQPTSCTNIAYLSILIFAQTTNFKEAINLALKLDNSKKDLALATTIIAESYYRNLPYHKIYNCRIKLPEKFQNLLMSFIKYCQRY